MLKIFAQTFIMIKNFWGDLMIKIHVGKVLEAKGTSTLSTEIEIGDAKKDVRLSVASEYGKYFSPERADYALVGMLAYALRNKHDIICAAPVTDELLYNIRELLIPTFVRSDARNYPVKIQAEIAPPLNKLDVAKATRGGLVPAYLAASTAFIPSLSI